MQRCLEPPCVFVAAPCCFGWQVWDEGIIANRITTSFAGDQDSYVTYLLKQIAGPWAANATGVQPLHTLDCPCVLAFFVPSLAASCIDLYDVPTSKASQRFHPLVADACSHTIALSRVAVVVVVLVVRVCYGRVGFVHHPRLLHLCQ